TRNDSTDASGSRSTGAASTRRPTRRGLRVLVHVSLADLLNLDGAAVEPHCAGGAAHIGAGSPDEAQASRLAMAGTDRFGPVLVEQLRDWLSRHGSVATVTPVVVDMQRSDAVDRHDPPEWMATQVRIRDEHCQFPHCHRSAWTCDLDHVTPYDPGGPPGQ